MLFYIGYKNDGVTPCKKQLRGAEFVGKAKNGAELYSVVPDANWADHRTYYYTIGGSIEGLCENAHINPYFTPEFVRDEWLPSLTDEQTAHGFPDRAGKLHLIREAITLGLWTSNGDAYFCELCGEFELAAQVRTARAEYRAKREQEERERAEREEKEKKERAAAEQREREQQLEKAEQDLRAGKFIAPAHFEQLANKYGVNLPIKFVGWLREWCGNIRLKRDDEYGGYITSYYPLSKKHKSTSIGTYGDKLGKAMAI